jgi:hypothetical protein
MFIPVFLSQCSEVHEYVGKFRGKGQGVFNDVLLYKMTQMIKILTLEY